MTCFLGGLINAQKYSRKAKSKLLMSKLLSLLLFHNWIHVPFSAGVIWVPFTDHNGDVWHFLQEQTVFLDLVQQNLSKYQCLVIDVRNDGASEIWRQACWLYCRQGFLELKTYMQKTQNIVFTMLDVYQWLWSWNIRVCFPKSLIHLL